MLRLLPYLLRHVGHVMLYWLVMSCRVAEQAAYSAFGCQLSLPVAAVLELSGSMGQTARQALIMCI
jgi:hypothetical protein